MIIKYKNREVDTKHFDGTIEIEKIKEVRDNFYKDFTKEKALKQLKNLVKNGSGRQNYVHGYYFEKIANDGILHHSKFSINEMLDSDELTQVFINKTYTNDKVFNSKDLTKNVKTAIRLGGKGLVAKLTNFPIKECVDVISRNVDNGKVYLDPCCGWGVRMIASAHLGLNYVGFDVNSSLVEKLNELGNDIRKIKPDWNFKIFTKGSQYLTKSCIGRADIIFTSPPYFNLENYNNNELESEDSISGSYEHWLSSFVKPMLENCSKYKSNKESRVCMNVKGFKEYDLVNDFIRLGSEVGLQFIELQDLKNNVRVSGGIGIDYVRKVDNSEHIIIFK